MSTLRGAALVAQRDLRIEMRSRIALGQILPFGGIVLLLFAFALDPDRGVLPRVAPGLLWVAVLLASLLAIGRAFSIEVANGARDGLRMSGLDGASVFLGKGAAVAAQLLVLQMVLVAGIVVLYDVELRGLAAVVLAGIAATIGLSAAGTLYGGLTLGSKVRETLVPLLVLPATAPVVLGGTRAYEWAFAGEMANAWPWVQMLGVFAIIYVVFGVLAFGAILEDS